MRIVCLLLSPGFNVQQLAECCLRFSPQIAIGEHWIFLEVGKCRHLYSEETVLKRLRVMLQRFGVFGQLVIADDLPTALAFAQYKSKSKDNLPVSALKFFLNPFRYSPTLDKMLEQMDKLGIYTIEDFRRLPRKTLAIRFGREGLLAAQQLNEPDRIVWPHFKVEEKIQESLVLSAAPESVETLLFFIKTLTDRVASRLIGRGERVCKFLLLIYQERFSHVIKPVREFLFELPLAQSAGVSLMSIIRERLSTQLTREPLHSEVELIEIRVLDTIPLKTSQKDLLHREEEEQEALAALVARLEEKLGKNSAFLAQPHPSYMPEKSWLRTLNYKDFEEKKSFIGTATTKDFESVKPFPRRPLRVLKKPLSLEREGSKIWCSQKTSDPIGLTHRAWHIASMTGPERIREEWWNWGTERDYYQIYTQEGEQLWVYYRRQDGSVLVNQSHEHPAARRLYLIGVFD